MNKKIGILYICSGKYIAFWRDFFDSFEKNFLTNTEKHYFVFTDHKDIYQCENNRVHIYDVPNLPWPLPTLLKYHMFLKYENDLLKMDYLYQSNANIVCENQVLEDSFLPKDSEKLFFTMHPSFINKKSQHCPFERNKFSKAYVPYSENAVYVYGAMNGGRSSDYIEMIKEIECNIESDLQRNIIAKWHDESHVNRYANSIVNKKILSSSYCYPTNFDIEDKRIIVGINKADKIDVSSIKGVENKQNIIKKVISYGCRYLKEDIFKMLRI